MERNSVKEIMNHRNNLRFKLVGEATVIGFLVGIVIVINRVLISKLTPFFNKLYSEATTSTFDFIKVFVIIAIVGLIVGVMVKKEPMISGSGIPQLEGILGNKLKINWFKVLVYKFFGGVLSLSAGLSVGREGPSVQMGGTIGEGFSKVLKRINIEEKFLITSGASAGLSAAFNAPLSGVIFALEEVHKNFSPLVLLSAMASSLAADFVCKQFLGLEHAMSFSDVAIFPLKYYWLLLIMGIVVGLSGIIFNKGLLKSQKIYGRFKNIPVEVRVMTPFICAAIVGIISPILLGGGHDLIMSLVSEGFTIKLLLIFLLVKFIFTFISFGSGAPGGIFFPLLVLGALVGNIFGMVACNVFGIPQEYIVNFIILAMAGHFAAIVKAPITGVILITEMTGSFEHMLAVALVVIVAYLTADIFKSEPIYESLLERILNKKENTVKVHRCNKTLIEVSVFMGSMIAEKYIKDISLPKECLLVAIKRGDREIIPKGNTKIESGDFLVILVDEDRVSYVSEEVKKMATKVVE